MSSEDCRSPIGLDCCSCCLDLANGYLPESPGHTGLGGLGSPTFSNHFRQLRDQLLFQNLNTDKLNNIIMRQDSLESVVRDPCYLLNEGICNSNIDQTMLSILLFFHSSETRRNGLRHTQGDADAGTRADIPWVINSDKPWLEGEQAFEGSGENMRSSRGALWKE
ncbi:hypothetical protein ACEWY4_026952 [Coilia grayii]|uniref:Uncharacterized protein n=1 Tax=Coilia grayii TaxID=363190 RepID=A0ABD1IV59_9TELE